jgi:hypothetical protein
MNFSVRSFLSVISLASCLMISACGSNNAAPVIATPSNTTANNCVAPGYAVYNGACSLANGGTGVAGNCGVAGGLYSPTLATCVVPCGNGLYMAPATGVCQNPAALGIVGVGGYYGGGYYGGVGYYGGGGYYAPIAPVAPIAPYAPYYGNGYGYGRAWGGISFGGGIVL